MNFKSALVSTSSIIILGSSLLLTGCEDNTTSNNNATGNNQSSTIPRRENSSAVLSDGLWLAFNGFSENGAFYDSNPMNLAGDLSATDPANLYLHDVFITNIGTKEKPSSVTAADYKRKLPASGKIIQTGITLLDPYLAMNGSTTAVKSVLSKFKLTPGIDNPVYLSVPAGVPERPEAPHFSTGTRYTGLIIEAPKEVGENHGAIISIEAGSTPVQFAALGHQQDKTFTLRAYDKASTIDKTGSRILLTAATQSAVIQSRFLVLTADGLARGNINLASIDRTSLPDFGVANGKALLQSLPPVFPQLINSSNKPIFNDGDHGVFCLGGNNTFSTVDLNDQTFVYPLSSEAKSTRIDTINISLDSGFITESGKHIEVDTLNGNGTLKLITVMKGAVTTDPIVHVKTLNSVNAVNVVIGVVDPAFVLPPEGMSLLSFDNTLATPPTVNTVDAHMAGAFYDGESEVRGKKIVLKSLTKKAKALSSGIALRSLANHPSTQGLSSQAMSSLVAMLDPMASVYTALGKASSALSQHTLGLQLNAPYSPKHQYVTQLSNNVNVSASNSADTTVASINLNSRYAGIDVSASVYGLTSSNQNDVAFGSSITAAKLFYMNGTMFIPSVAVGYSMDVLGDKTLSTPGINVNLSDAQLNSVFARLATALQHNHNGLSATLTMGLEARHAMFTNGRAFTNYDSVSLAGESANSVYSVVEASFASNSTRLNITLSNFNHAQIQFGFNN